MVCILCFRLQKAIDSHRKALKGGAFRLSSFPQSFFDDNPFRSDRSLPPLQKTEFKSDGLQPFKPSSPAKRVRLPKRDSCDFIYNFTGISN